MTVWDAEPGVLRSGEYVGQPQSRAYVELDAIVRASEERLLEEDPEAFSKFFHEMAQRGMGRTIANRKAYERALQRLRY